MKWLILLIVLMIVFPLAIYVVYTHYLVYALGIGFVLLLFYFFIDSVRRKIRRRHY